MATDTAFGFNTPFKEQLDFFRQKLNLPSERYDDITKQAHDKAFIVAGVARADMLADFNSAIEKAIAQGKGQAEFSKDFNKIVAKHGWTNFTGSGSAAGIAWRTKVIYQTNMLTSYAAGRYKQLTDPAFLKIHPNWKYVHDDTVQHPRLLHQSWDGTVLPHDHPFWQTHFAPNGWGCQCRVVAARFGEAITPPPEGWNTIDPKTGAPIGIDKGFDYAFGASTDVPIRQFVQDKLIKYPPAITRALTKEINKYIDAETDVVAFVNTALGNKDQALLWLGFVENYEAIDQAINAAESVKGYIVNLPADAIRHHFASHQYDGNGQRVALPEDYKLLLMVLTEADKLTESAGAIAATKRIGRETFKAVFDVRRGKNSRMLALKSLVIKTGGG